MSPKTAIIILLILAVLMSIFFIWLYYTQLRPLPSPVITVPESQQKTKSTNELSSPELKALELEKERLEIIKKLNQKKATLSPEELKAREEERLEIIKKLNQEKNN